MCLCGMGSTWLTWDLGRSASSIWGRAWYWPGVSLCLQVCGFIWKCICADDSQRLFIQVLPPGGGIFLTSVHFSSVTQSCPTLCNPMNSSMPGLPVHHQLPESLRLTSIESVMASSHLILCRPLLLLAPIPPSIRVFSNESTLRTH